MLTLSASIALTALITLLAGGGADTTLSAADAARILEARRLASFRASIWPGWEATPMPMLLVTETTEFLVSGLEPGQSFSPLGPYPGLGPVHVRDRQLNPALLATFPWFAGGPTIIVGQAGRTGKTSGEWTVTILHEHFHQFQYGKPGYIAGVKALDLSGGDETGMWMLNFPFPYDTSRVAARADSLKRVLLAFVEDPKDPAGSRRAACSALAALHAELRPAEQRYLQFQLWQEGVPRYIELEVAEVASASGQPPVPAFAALPDAAPYGAVAAALRAGLRTELSAPFSDLDRVNFYSMGAAMALLLDATSPAWKGRYHDAGFRLDQILCPS